jgi:hypothetical protein
MIKSRRSALAASLVGTLLVVGAPAVAFAGTAGPRADKTVRKSKDGEKDDTGREAAKDKMDADQKSNKDDKAGEPGTTLRKAPRARTTSFKATKRTGSEGQRREGPQARRRPEPLLGPQS